MELDAQRAALLDAAETWVKRFVKERGGFSMFAVAKHRDGALNPIQPTDEFPDPQSALVETIRVLLALAKEEQIVASVICSQVPMGRDRAVMYDLESKDAGRVLVLVPMKKKRFLGGWVFGERLFKSDDAKVFAGRG